MFVLPILSIVVEWFAVASGDLLFLVGKWFVFWSVGVRLAMAGMKQILDPGFTARTIFEIEDPDAQKIVSELGFANVAIGTVALTSLFIPGWTLPVALAGAIFYGLAGARHIGNKDKNRIENFATYSDLWIALVLAVFVIGTALRLV
jgi:hypothetical protein